MIATLAQHTDYRPPPRLQTVVSKVHPAGETPIPGLLDDNIHVFLPALPRVEFAALIPKGNHVTIIVAGHHVTSQDVERVLGLSAVHSLLPCDPQPEDYFKGSFPVGLAQCPYGDRYVTLGDSAGLVRPFKGKGVNSAIITGHLAAMAMLQRGVSREAFRYFWRDCGEFVGDIFYGRLVRRLANLTSHQFSLEPVIALARQDASFRRTLYDCVSGRETYRRIVRRRQNIGAVLRLAPRLLWTSVRGGRD
jgi:flavin-dependent dehydrogenase